MRDENKFLVVVDGSYFMYFTLFGAVTEFQKKYAEESSVWIKPPEECDQNNLPNLLNCATFVKVLKRFVMKRLETVDSIVRQNFQDEIDSVNRIDFVFAMDDRLKHNFRLALYPQYKAHRALVKRSYQVQVIKDYIIDVIFKEIDIEDSYGYRLVKVEGAEGDDVVATLLTKFKDKYVGTALIASDHDFLQIDGIREFDLFGREAKRTLGDEEVSANDFLLGKILMGDKSDNIQQVFMRCGPKTALRLVKNKDALKNMLRESQESSERFKLNKKIISFSEIPNDLTERITKTVNETLYRNDVLNPKVDLRDFMLM